MSAQAADRTHQQRRRQHRERGQALLFALIALLIASMAAAFVAEDITLREKALQEEGARFHLRALLDGALADALARLAEGRSLESEDRWGAGFTSVESIYVDRRHVRLLVYARYLSRRGAVEALVETDPAVQVLTWRRIHPG